jgi:hypothetical protein
MGYDYLGERQAAFDMITEFGAPAFLRRQSALVNIPCHLVIDDYKPFERLTSAIQYTDRKMIASAQELVDFIPNAETDTIFFQQAAGDIPAGAVLRIVTSKPTAPGGVNVIFELQSRI